MSYCVNCGVELDKTCNTCPLCQTPVYHPNQAVDTTSPRPYPTQKGETETVQPYEFTILMSIVLGTTALVCFLLNRFVFTSTSWSFYTMGLCALMWLFLIPAFFPNALPTRLILTLNGLGIAAYLGLISWLHPGKGWYFHIALPITLLATAMVLVQYTITLRRKSSFIKKAGLFFGNLALLCVVIELLTDLYFDKPIFFTWSAIVFTCCFCIDVVLITISFLGGVRAELRRRMHF